MKRHTAINERGFFRWHILAGLSSLILFLNSSGCTIFGADEYAPEKNKNLIYEAPADRFSRVEVSSADRVWQSKVTGSTIAMNSGCSEAEVKEFKAKEFLSGLDQLSIKSQSKFTVDATLGDRIHASGKAERVPITVDLVTFKKGECTYDLAYVSREATYESELKIFEAFVKAFRAP